MTLDERTEKLLKVYDRQENMVRKDFLRDPSTDNFRVREYIPDARGDEMYSQNAGLTYLELNRGIEELLADLSSGMDSSKYQEVKSKYSLSEEGKKEFYLELARREMLPDNASDELKQIAGAAQLVYGVQEKVYTGKHDEVVDFMKGIARGTIDEKLATQYQNEGQVGNVGATVLRFAEMQKRVAKSKLTTEMSVAIDKEIAKSNDNRARAAGVLYSVYNSNKSYQAPKEEGKKK